MGDISKTVANTLWLAKQIYKKKTFSGRSWFDLYLSPEWRSSRHSRGLGKGGPPHSIGKLMNLSLLADGAVLPCTRRGGSAGPQVAQDRGVLYS